MSIGEQNREELAKLLPTWDPAALQALCDEAGFTITDMATWCECDRAAMWYWVRAVHTPNRVRQNYLKPRLMLLRRMLVGYPDVLPVPADITQYARLAYIQKVLRHALNLPAENSAK